MNIYLRHETHGNKVAISELEAQFDERHGWKRYDPETHVKDDVPNWMVNEAVKPRKTKGA